ncbi:Ig domain-containing protein, partial [uncultured Citricoccus sp.]|uniref:Ig domain-containing protein n=1 Tax=uncultured Citricoccus sp. TaxID=614031 RepID=UPI00261AF0A5
PESDTVNFGVESSDLDAPAGGIDLGYTSEDGVAFTFGREVEDILGWQSADPLRKLSTAEPRSAAFTLQQLERGTWLSSMGGTLTELSAGPPPIYRWEPTVGQIPTGRLVIDFEDGPAKYRFGFRRAQNTAETEFSLVRNAALALSNEWTGVATSDGKTSFFMDTNDAAFAPGGSDPTVTTTALGALEDGAPFSQALVASGTGPFTWAMTAGSLPAGIVLYASGILAGTPSAPGAYDFTVTVTGANGTDTQQYTGTVGA